VSSNPCQIDFYLLGEASMQADTLTCRLAMMAWERDQHIFVSAPDMDYAHRLNKIMWDIPGERFLPHAICGAPQAEKAPVKIGAIADLNTSDVVINLCQQAIPQPERFKRVLEIVPFKEKDRGASRIKYQAYCKQGIKPHTHEISK